MVGCPKALLQPVQQLHCRLTYAPPTPHPPHVDCRDEIIIGGGSQVGALMVDGYGDGLLMECGSGGCRAGVAGGKGG